jgi:hypothetical protein
MPSVINSAWPFGSALARRAPTSIGCIERGPPRNAAVRESERIRYLPSFTDEIAYITTKKANSSVIKSP